MALMQLVLAILVTGISITKAFFLPGIDPFKYIAPISTSCHLIVRSLVHLTLHYP